MYRRRFLKIALPAAAGAAIGTPLFLKWYSKNRVSSASASTDFFPIQKLHRLEQTEFSGDRPHRAHGALWNKQEFLQAKGGLPKEFEKAEVVIVGGGVAGLSAAYYLKQSKPILLEQASSFGGNSKGEDWRGLRYSIGAAYITPTDEGSLSHSLFTDIGISELSRTDEDGEGSSVLFRNKVHHEFWSGSLDPASRNQFVKFRKLLDQIRNAPYPDIPPRVGSMSRKNLHTLDQISFQTWLQKNIGQMPPLLTEFLQEYCWSSFAAGIEELSAAQAINFLASDLFAIRAFPGGNAAITEALTKNLIRDLPPKHLRQNCLVIDVRLIENQHVQITYEDADGKLRAIRTKACIVTCPKFVAKKIVDQIPADQKAAIEQLRYRAYVVANLILKRKISSPTYDLYRLTGNVNTAAAQSDNRSRPFADMIFGDWAAHDKSESSVLTLYKPYAFEGGRSLLYAEGSYAEVKAELEKSIPEICESLEIKRSDVAALRLSRWGHPVPVAAPGLLSKGVAELAARPIANSIFFAQQDNWANPCFETALNSAKQASDAVGKLF